MSDKKEFKTAEDAMMDFIGESKGAPVQEQTAEQEQEISVGNEETGEELEDAIISQTDSEDINDSETSEETSEANAEVDAEIDQEEDISDWDDTPATSNEPVIDFSAIGKSIGNEKIKTQDELVEYVNTLNTNVKELKDQSSLLEGLPEDLRQAIQIAKDKGDYREYLGLTATDFSTVDPRDLFEAQLIDSGLFNNTDGSLDEDRLSDYLDALPDQDVVVRGTQIKNELVARQQTKKQTLEREAAQRKVAETAALKETLDKTESINGFKLKPNHKKDLFEGIQSGKLFNELFYDKTGKYDYKKVVENTFLLKNKEAIFNYLRTKSTNQGKKAIIDKLTNPDINTSSSRAEPKEQKKATGIDLLLQETMQRFQ